MSTGEAALAAEIARLWDELGVLSRAVEALVAEDRGAPSRLIWWPSLPVDEREAAWETLADWVDSVIVRRHPMAGRAVTECWYRHPDVVDELTALRHAWLAVYDAQPRQATAAIEWHDRWLPAALKRVQAALGSCRQSHMEISGATRGNDADETFAAFVAQDVTAARLSG